MKKLSRKQKFLIFMFSITSTFGFIAMDVVTHSKPHGVTWVKGTTVKPLFDTQWK